MVMYPKSYSIYLRGDYGPGLQNKDFMPVLGGFRDVTDLRQGPSGQTGNPKPHARRFGVGLIGGIYVTTYTQRKLL